MLSLIALFVALAGQAAEPARTPAEAIAIADAHPGRGATGIFRVTVAAAERGPNAVYLNSTTDYRGPDNLTLHLTLPAARALEKRIGGKPETVLVGRTLTVRGAVRAVPIANTVAGRPHSFNRFQHSVLIQQANQITVD